MNGDPVRRNFGVDDELFGLGVSCQLCRVDDHGSGHRRRAASPQRQKAFLFGDSGQSVKDARVASSLLGRKSAVRRHSDKGNLGRRPDKGADASGRHAEEGFGEESGRGTVLRRHLEERLIYPHSRRRVRRLSQETGRESVVHAEDALSFDDISDCVEAGLVRFGPSSFPAHLHPVLDEVEWLDEEGGAHPGGTAEKKLDRVGYSQGRSGRR